ncbi:restriction endonuclease subunit S [Vibrio rumoiensis]|uniref:Restriction endonuclease subunit S n=1 Tax=Vibrio rumoiensis 1S-45 TaxID=1188252 RepID=A0A1E5E2G9_9VIBR|nr:restriction endonuclease subunit S [Vibrio rumoiensis]OEF25673.1 restriction endonuclease subunit S [Vibrio rumoiensis 1S-45]
MSDSLIANDLITEHIDIWTSTVKTKSASGRGSSKKIDLYGIKKLRELILELAVRGKLVPQDPSDEPASVLLAELTEIKNELIKKKVLKKSKKQPPITDDEKRIDIPKGWIWSRLEDVYDVRDGTHDSPKPQFEGYPLVTSKNLSSGSLDLSDIKFISKEDHLKIIERSKVDVHDILFAMIGSIGNPVIVDTDIEFSIKNVGLFKYYNLDKSCPKFLVYFLHYAAEIFKKQSSGGVQPFVSLGKLRSFTIAFPPLPEQHRIVAKVDELMALCDQLEQQTESQIEAQQTLVSVLLETLTTAKNHNELMQNWQRLSEHFDTLFTTEQSIDQLKQTILQLAVMGRLVPQDPTDEPASKLLERIAVEKAQLIADKKIKKQKALPPISDDEKPFELPDGWEWCKFGNITICRLGKMLDQSKNIGIERPYLRNTNVQWNRFDLGDIKLMKIEDHERNEFRVLVGDLLICEGGEPGRCAIWKDKSQEIYFQKALHRARTLGNCSPEYLQLCLTIDAAIGTLDKYFTGATIKHFVGAKLNNYIHPLPPLQEQHRIVTKVDELMAICDQLKAKLNQSQQTQLHLTDAIVEQVV